MLPPRIARFWKEQSGVIGIEAAIMVIALVVVAVGFANAALTAGLLFSDTAEKTATETVGRLEVIQLRGSVVVNASATGTAGVVSDIAFQVANVTRGERIDLTPGTIIIKYSDSGQSKMFDSSAGFSVTGIGSANSDMLLEPGELYEIEMSGLDVTGDGSNQLTNPLGPSTTFSLEVIPPNGSVLHVRRSTPTSLDPIMRLD